MPRLEQGRIVWAELPSSDESARKRRPAVVVTSTMEIKPGESFVIVVATTKFDEPLPEDHVRLPWHRNGTVRTKLTKPTVAVCSWLAEIRESDVLQMGGVVPSRELLEIVQKVAKLLPPGSEGAPTQSGG